MSTAGTADETSSMVSRCAEMSEMSACCRVLSDLACALESLAFSASLMISGGELELWLATSAHEIATWPRPVSRDQQWMASGESDPRSPSNWAWPAGSLRVTRLISTTYDGRLPITSHNSKVDPLAGEPPAPRGCYSLGIWRANFCDLGNILCHMALTLSQDPCRSM
mmetsp:Transcript_37759/g.59670  ORF Transcript_37759/g.59670 Transcript_37759/m.59670 type:complete len:167 (+) Transcript_37759:125-625(+)